MVFINFSWLRLLIDQMHIAQRVRKAADDEINDRSTQVLVSLIETRVDHQASFPHISHRGGASGPRISESCFARIT